MQKSIRALCECLRAGQAVATATIVHQTGSTPRGAGSKLLAHSGGLLQGSIGGGLSEALSLQACAHALEVEQNNAPPRVLHVDLSGELAAQSTMICGGTMQVLIETWYPEESTLQFFTQALQAMEEQGGMLVRPMPLSPKHTGEEAPIHGAAALSLVLKTSVVGAALPEDLVRAVRAQGPLPHATTIHAGGHDYFMEACTPPWQMIIAGGGHVSLSTAQIARLAGFVVHVLDDRPEFAAAERFPWAASTKHCPEFFHCFSGLSVHAHTCIVIVTRGHVHDGRVLTQALHSGASYIGMIGSKRKRDALYQQVQQEGVAASALAQVHCPIGLSIHAETPEEIAVSIVAECIAHKRGALAM